MSDIFNALDKVPQQWNIENLIPYEKNAKIHDPIQVRKIADAIRTSGWDQPIVVDRHGVIIKGHGRRLAAMHLGMKFVPVVVRDDLSDDEVKAARLSDNRVAQADYDAQLIQEELMELAGAEVDLSMLGFDERELSFLTDDLGDMNMNALIDDLNAEVTEQTQRTESKVEQVQAREVSIAEAFGFKVVTVDQSRLIKKLMARIEEDYEAQGAEALSAFAQNLVG